MTFWNAFSWMNISLFWFKFHWSWFLRVQLTISKHWLRLLLGTKPAMSHYWSNGDLVYWHIYMHYSALVCSWKHKYTFAFTITSQPWQGRGTWNPVLWKTRTCFSCKVNIISDDDLVMQGVRASAAMILTYFFLEYSRTRWVKQPTGIWPGRLPEFILVRVDPSTLNHLVQTLPNSIFA